MRSWLIRIGLIVAAVAVGAWIWTWSSGDQGQGRGLQGGPLFPFGLDDLASIELHRAGGSDTLVRNEDGTWRLEGTVADIVDAKAFQAVFGPIVEGQGHAVLAGTEPDERRYGFGSETALELVFHRRDGVRDRLALGDANAVSGLIYASGAGRRGVFGVGGGLYAKAVRLPDNVRYNRIFPRLDAVDLDSLHVDRGPDQQLNFVRWPDGRWWVRLPEGRQTLTGKADRYNNLYDDRRLDHHGAVWFLADQRHLTELVYRVTDTKVAAFPSTSARRTANLEEVGLIPLYRGATLFATGGLTRRVEFGHEQDQQLVMARRDGALVVTRNIALHPLEGPVSGFLDLGALSFRLADADSFHIDEVVHPLIWGRKAADPAARRANLKSIWDAGVPPQYTLSFGAETTGNHVADVQTYLDRLECMAVREPVTDDCLLGRDRWRITAWMPDGVKHTVWLGTSLTDGKPVLWEPGSGKVLEVPGEILVTMRGLRGDLK